MSSAGHDVVTYEREDGIVTLEIDDPGQRVNTMNAAYASSMAAAVDRVLEEIAAGTPTAGVIISSGKKTFFAGGDLKHFIEMGPDDAATLYEETEAIKTTLRRLETSGKPVVAAIGGAALGGGLEIALAAHHRIAVDGTYDIGLPEVTLGLLPGGGGVVRLVRMLGIQTAVDILTTGARFSPADALEVGLVDAIVADRAGLLPAAREWIRTHADDESAASQPWDRRGYSMPGGFPSDPKLNSVLAELPARISRKSKGADVRAPRSILAAAVEGAQIDFAGASRIETRYFVELVVGQQSKNMTQAFFFDMGSIRAGGSRPSGFDKTKVSHLAIVGAGMMGSGIAAIAAKAGVTVHLKDISLEAADKGKGNARAVLDGQVKSRTITAEQRDEILARILPTDDYSDLGEADFVIEAVFESAELKKKIYAELEPAVKADAVLGSNTSTLPISDLATGVQRPSDFIGVHFFSPVHRMPLVEIIVGKETSDAVLARAIDFVGQIGMTPIVVSDSRGFFTSRVFQKLIHEGAELLNEGVDPVLIEKAAWLAGFPGQPLAMIDEVSLTLEASIKAEARAAAEAAGGSLPVSGAEKVILELITQGRKGKAAGAGFYNYPAGEKKRLWPGLRERFTRADADIALEVIQERLLFVMSLDTIRCLEEGVLHHVADANVGSIVGIGFPPIHGGAVQYANSYERDGERGVRAFAKRAGELAEAYGARFTPPALLLDKASRDEKF